MSNRSIINAARLPAGYCISINENYIIGIGIVILNVCGISFINIVYNNFVEVILKVPRDRTS